MDLKKNNQKRYIERNYFVLLSGKGMLVCIHSVLCSSVVKEKKSIPGFTNMSRQFVSSVGIHLQTVRDDHEWQRLQMQM